jgi:transglutaminase-like putative cysteine protease
MMASLALTVLAGVMVACASERPQRRQRRLTTDDLYYADQDAALTYDGPYWHFHNGRLFSLLAHTFGATVFGKERSLAEITVRNNLKYPQKLTFWLDAGPYASEAVKEIVLQPGEQRTVHLSPTFDYERLYALRSPTPVQLQFGMDNHFTDDRILVDATPILEPVTRIQWKLPAKGDQKAVDLRHNAIMLVTPDDRAGEVQKLIREAAPRTARGYFAGYVEGGALHEVEDQVKALYEALRARGYIYNSVASTYFDELQRVRLPAESLAQNHGNCIDTTLVFASALEAIGLEPLIVFMTGHAMVGVELDPNDGDKWIMFETTVVGEAPYRAARELAQKTFRERHNKDPGFVIHSVKKGRKLGLYPVNF